MGRSVVRVFIRRTHLGHGVVMNSPKYSYAERVIDKAISDTYMDFYACLATSSIEWCLPSKARDVYEKELEEGYPEQDARFDAITLAEEIYANEACDISKEFGVECFTISNNRPVFVPSENVLYIGGYFGNDRDPDTGALHPTVVVFERKLPKTEMRKIAEKLGELADEGNLEEIVYDSIKKKYGSEKAWRLCTCVSEGGCEVEGELDEKGNLKVIDVRILTPDWKRYVEGK